MDLKGVKIKIISKDDFFATRIGCATMPSVLLFSLFANLCDNPVQLSSAFFHNFRLGLLAKVGQKILKE